MLYVGRARPQRQRPGGCHGAGPAQECIGLCSPAGLCLQAGQGLRLYRQVGIAVYCSFYFIAVITSISVISEWRMATLQCRKNLVLLILL